MCSGKWSPENGSPDVRDPWERKEGNDSLFLGTDSLKTDCSSTQRKNNRIRTRILNSSFKSAVLRDRCGLQFSVKFQELCPWVPASRAWCGSRPSAEDCSITDTEEGNRGHAQQAWAEVGHSSHDGDDTFKVASWNNRCGLQLALKVQNGVPISREHRCECGSRYTQRHQNAPNADTGAGSLHPQANAQWFPTIQMLFPRTHHLRTKVEPAFHSGWRCMMILQS